MLRLCYGLNRYSVDLDFSLVKEIDSNKFFEKCRDYLRKNYTMKKKRRYYIKNNFKLLKLEIIKELQ